MEQEVNDALRMNASVERDERPEERAVSAQPADLGHDLGDVEEDPGDVFVVGKFLQTAHVNQSTIE
jgi:hypothetical protein